MDCGEIMRLSIVMLSEREDMNPLKIAHLCCDWLLKLSVSL